MCDQTLAWEPDPDVEGSHRLKPVTCEEKRRRLIARITFLENELVTGRVRFFEGERRADITEGRVLDGRLGIDPQ